MRRCRLGAADGPPFACPDGCLFFEERPLSTAGWATEGEQLSNTALGLAGLPDPKRPPSGRPGNPKSKKGRRNK